jgi:hypothetical protein
MAGRTSNRRKKTAYKKQRIISIISLSKKLGGG